MAFDEAYFSIGRLDRLAYGDTIVHRLDPRAKVFTTMLFIVTVISYSKYEVASLVPFLVFPVVLTALADLPAGFLLRKVLALSPFAVCIGMFNPLLETRTAVVLFGAPVSAGWVSFVSILLKYVLTISVALILIATTSFPGVCNALRRFGVPAAFVSQLLFLYRYLFVLLEEAMRIVRARELRSFGAGNPGVKEVIRIIGALFLRTMERAERIFRAMLSRGFRGEVTVLQRREMQAADGLFLLGSVCALGLFRWFPVAEWTGRLAAGLLR